jgi:hypothetical protein
MFDGDGHEVTLGSGRRTDIRGTTQLWGASVSTGGEADRLLDLARAELRQGSVARSWQLCLEAAAVGRAAGDAAVVADAAIVITGGFLGDWAFMDARHELCR